MKFNDPIEGIFDELFWNCFNNECENLNKYDDYREQGDICSNIISSNQKIQYYIENDKACAFTLEEVEELIKYNKAERKRNDIELKKVFYAGAKFMFYFMNKANMINKSIESDSSEN